MKAEREKIHAKVKADTVRLNGSKLELTADEETCTFPVSYTHLTLPTIA